MYYEDEESQMDINSNISQDIDFSKKFELLYIVKINEPKNQNKEEIKERKERKEETKIEIQKRKSVSGNSENCFEKKFEKKEKDEKNEENIDNEDNKDNDANDNKVMFLIENEKTLKIGNNIKNKSYRCDNIIRMIIRNLIQEIFLDWINYGESDNSKLIYKINPQIFPKYYDFRGKKLKEIYSKEISKKEIQKHSINNEHNILIIKSPHGIQNTKLNYSFEEALKLFFCKNIAPKNISQIINIDENVEDEILKGLKGKEEYINRKGGNSSYKQKLIKALDKIKKDFVVN